VTTTTPSATADREDRAPLVRPELAVDDAETVGGCWTRWPVAVAAEPGAAAGPGLGGGTAGAGRRTGRRGGQPRRQGLRRLRERDRPRPAGGWGSAPSPGRPPLTMTTAWGSSSLRPSSRPGRVAGPRARSRPAGRAAGRRTDLPVLVDRLVQRQVAAGVDRLQGLGYLLLADAEVVADLGQGGGAVEAGGQGVPGLDHLEGQPQVSEDDPRLRGRAGAAAPLAGTRPAPP
jgi:hypothetical protein